LQVIIEGWMKVGWRADAAPAVQTKEAVAPLQRAADGTDDPYAAHLLSHEEFTSSPHQWMFFRTNTDANNHGNNTVHHVKAMPPRRPEKTKPVQSDVEDAAGAGPKNIQGAAVLDLAQEWPSAMDSRHRWVFGF
jgi:hypothetical protein